MKRVFTLVPCLLLAVVAMAQLQGPPNGDNQKSRVTQWIGPVEISITYSSPNVHDPQGKDRTDHIWGELVPYGFNDLGFGTSKAAPWRAGANENTIITFSHDVKVGGKDLKAGTYGLFLDVEKSGPWVWIFSKKSTAWGSFFYDQKDDALRIESTPVDAAYTEFLAYGFDDRQLTSAVAFLQWEKKKVSFTVDVPNINDLYLAGFRAQLEGTPTGFTYQAWRDAAQFCADNKVNLEEGLKWADAAISAAFIGQENFSTLKTKSDVLNALNRKDEATALMTKAINLPTAQVAEIHMYGRSVLASGDNKRAMEIFQLNAKKHPEDTFTIFVGLARGYTANGDKKNAIANWEKAIKNIPENQKPNIEFYKAELEKLKKA